MLLVSVMRILQLCNKVPFPPKDGGSIATYCLSKGFGEQKHYVTILAMNTTKHRVDISAISEKLQENVELIGININTDITPAKAAQNLFFSRLPYNAIRFISEDYAVKLKEVLQNQTFDIIQLEGLYLCPYITEIRKLSKAKIVLRTHNIEHEIWQRTTALEKNLLKKKYLSILTKRLKRFETGFINQYDLLVPITQRDGLLFDKLGNTKPVCIIPTGIETNLYSIETEESVEFPSLFFIGALDWSPNQEGLLWFLNYVWPKIMKSYPAVKLHIAGRNAPGWFIEKLRCPNTLFHGELDDAAEIFRSKAIMIVPLLTGSGMRIKIIEGMAAKKAIVTTSKGTEGIPATNGKNLIIADNPDQFATEIKTLVENREICDEIGKNAFTFVAENFDNRKLSKKLLNFFNTFIN